ncbi:MAG: glycosyltransferase [Promethearchaeota archaeon]
MKILILYNLLPVPNAKHGGGIYLFNFISHFSKNHDIYLYCFYFKKNEKYISDLRPYTKELFTLEINESIPRLSQMLQMLKRSLLLGYPLQNNYIYSDKMVKKIHHLIKTEKIDVIYCENIYMAHYFDYLPKKFKGKLYLREDDLNFIALRENLPIVLLKNINNFLKLKFSLYDLFQLIEHLEFKRYKKFQKKIWKRVDLLSTASDVEHYIISKINPKKKIRTYYHGINGINLNHPKTNDSNLLFIGNYSHYPNEDAVLYFLNKIFPIIQRNIQDVKFYIIGANPPKSFSKRAKLNSGVQILGFVNDLKDVYNKCTISVCPVRLGGGFRTKILEAIAYGLPVVSTTKGVEGIFNLIRNKNFILHSDNDIRFAEHVIKLLKDTDLRLQKVKEGQKFIKRFLWSKIFSDLECELVK